jgi:uncharacterized protein YbjT (DUF2867 family)
VKVLVAGASGFVGRRLCPAHTATKGAWLTDTSQRATIALA